MSLVNYKIVKTRIHSYKKIRQKNVDFDFTYQSCGIIREVWNKSLLNLHYVGNKFQPKTLPIRSLTSTSIRIFDKCKPFNGFSQRSLKESINPLYATVLWDFSLNHHTLWHSVSLPLRLLKVADLLFLALHVYLQHHLVLFAIYKWENSALCLPWHWSPNLKEMQVGYKLCLYNL